jgi:hypothetical protein
MPNAVAATERLQPERMIFIFAPANGKRETRHQFRKKAGLAAIAR